MRKWWLFAETSASQAPALAIENVPRTIGRSPSADLVIPDAIVSALHATVWVDEDGAAWVRDLGSRNGTLIGGEPISGTTRLISGAHLRIAGHTFLVRTSGEAVAPDPHGLFLADGDDAYLMAIPAVGAPLRPHDGSALFQDGTRVWITRDGTLHEVPIGEVLAVHGRPFRVVRHDVRARFAPTIDAPDDTYDYRLRLSLNGPDGPRAVVETGDGRRRHVVDAENRVVLLYALGVRARSAFGAWCTNAELRTAIWGRSSLDDNNLSVLAHRVRAELRSAGFAPDFLQRRRGAMRLLLRDVLFDEEGRNEHAQA